MDVLRFNYKNKEFVLTVEDTVYTFGNIMTVIDVYFRETRCKYCPSKLRIMASNEDIDDFLSILNNNTYIELDKYGKYIDFMECYYKISGYVSDNDLEKISNILNREPEESLLDWSDSVFDDSSDDLFSESESVNSMLNNMFEEDLENSPKELDFVYDDKSKSVGDFYGK